MIKIIFTCVFLVFTSCTCSNIDNQQTRDIQTENIDRKIDTFYQINMDDIINSSNLSKIDTVIDKINYIYTESKSGAIMSEVNLNVCKVNNKYIMSSFRSNGIFQFDSLGRYEKTIITRGKARNELSSDLYRWAYNKPNNTLTISLGRKMINYDFNSEKSWNINFAQYYYYTAMLNDNNYVVLPNINGNSEPESTYLIFLDDTGKMIENKKYSKNRDVASEMLRQYDGPSETYGLYPNNNGAVLYRDLYNDTIYKVISKDKLEPYIVLNRNKRTPSVKDDNIDKKRTKIYFKDINETRKYLYIKYQYDEKIWSVIIDKNSSEIISKTEIDIWAKTTPFINYSSFFKCEIFNENSITVGVVSYDEDKIYCIARPIDLEHIDDYQNPVIMEVFLK